MGRKILMGCGALSILGVLVLAAVGFLAVLGNTGSSTAGTDPGGPTAPEEPGEPEVEAPEQETAEPAPEPESAPEPEPEPEPITLSGSGPQATETFRLEDGLVVARMSHQGASNFIVQPIDETGALAGVTLANQIGPFEGTAATGATAGTYLLNVDADGPWYITLNQPRPPSAPETRQFSGTGMTATEPFSLTQGLARFEMSHQGESNFIVSLLDRGGNPVGMGLANEIGPFEGSQAAQVPEDGIYLLSVSADGPWTITVD